ncbi:MAG: AI-2E family transporter [Syntrophales bacterium]|jgi:predicted PurR-regulated permease PerM
MASSKVQNVLFIILLVSVSVVFLYILKPFAYPLFWAGIIASLFYPLYQRLQQKMNMPSLNTAIVLLLISVIIIIPSVIIGSVLFNQIVQVYESISTDPAYIQKIIQGFIKALTYHPFLDRLHIKQSFWTDKIAEIMKNITNYAFMYLTDLTQNTIVFLTKFIIMFYALFFFIRDGEMILNAAMRLFSLGMDRERLLFEHFITTAKSTLKVTMIIGGLQGSLGGMIFYLTGIEGSLIWGGLMIFAAIIPAVGCSIIWAPAGILMILTGHIRTGIIILLFGALVISTVDTVLRPILIGKDIQMHTLLIFLSSLGGIVLFGFSGFVIGPIIASLMMAILDMYDEVYRKDIMDTPSDET